MPISQSRQRVTPGMVGAPQDPHVGVACVYAGEPSIEWVIGVEP